MIEQDAHGAGWRLVLTVSEPAAIERGLASWFSSIGGKVVTIPADDTVYGQWFAEHKATVALQRPDFHLYGTAVPHRVPRCLLDRLRTQLSAELTLKGAGS